MPVELDELGEALDQSAGTESFIEGFGEFAPACTVKLGVGSVLLVPHGETHEDHRDVWMEFKPHASEDAGEVPGSLVVGLWTVFADSDMMRCEEGMTMPKKGLVALAIPIVLSLTSCGDSDDGAGSSDATTDAGSASLVVAWDGTDCVYEGPAEVPAGAVAVDYVNNGDALANLFVVKLDGVTVEDVMEEFATEPRTSNVLPGGWLDMGGDPPADPGETLQWERNLAPGEYVLICTRSRVGGWFGSGLTVVEG